MEYSANFTIAFHNLRSFAKEAVLTYSKHPVYYNLNF